MQALPIEIVDETALARPSRDVPSEPGLVGQYQLARRGHHLIRRSGSVTSCLVYTVSGGGFFRDAKNRLIVVGRGDLVLLEAHTYQECGTNPQSRHWKYHAVYFDVPPHWQHWLPLADGSALEGLSTTHLDSRAAQNQMRDLFAQLHGELARREFWSRALALNVIERILILARVNAGSAAAARSIDPRIARVWKAIEGSASAAPSATALSRIAGLSPSRLSFLFKQATGISLHAAVNRVRLGAAQIALQTPGTSLREVAERVGFKSPYSFSNWYLKQTGLRPAEYRRRWLGGTGAASAPVAATTARRRL